MIKCWIQTTVLTCSIYMIDEVIMNVLAGINGTIMLF